MLVGVVDIAQYEMSTLTATFCATPELVQIMCRYGHGVREIQALAKIASKLISSIQGYECMNSLTLHL